MAEFDISAELEKENVEYERKHKKDIRLGVINEKTGKVNWLGKKKKGWKGESLRHSLSRKGVKTGKKNNLRPAGWKSMKLGDLLTKKQMNELIELSEKGKPTHKELLELVKKDDSKYKGKVIPEYLTYAIEYGLRGA